MLPAPTKKILFIALGIMIVVAIFLLRSKSKENVQFGLNNDVDLTSQEMRADSELAARQNLKSTFSPAKQQAMWFQGMPPSTKVENDYHRYIKEECGGDYGNYECRQKAYIKTMKAGTFDKVDLICWNHRNDEDAYYRCLDGVYGNYLWMDRFKGTDPCACPDGTQGASTVDGCHCPPYRPLNIRSPLDNNMQPIEGLASV